MTNEKLISLFKEELFLPELKAKTKNDALHELVKKLVETGHVKNDRVILGTILQREALGSTGIGKGVAIPHCRSLAVGSMQIAVGISPEGIPFDSKDKKDVNLIILVIAPPIEDQDQYLPMLGKLCELLNQSKLRTKLFGATDFQTFIQTINGV